MSNILANNALTQFRQAVDTYQATGAIDENITLSAAGTDPSNVATAIFLAAGGPIRMAALARDDKVLLDKVWPEYMKTATRKRAISAKVETRSSDDLVKLSNADLAEIILEGE